MGNGADSRNTAPNILTVSDGLPLTHEMMTEYTNSRQCSKRFKCVEVAT